MERTKPLTVYGPQGTKYFFDSMMGQKENYGLTFPLEIQEIEEGVVCNEDDYRIIAKRVMHSIYTMAFAYIEKDRLGRFDKEKAKKLKVKKGQKWQELQQGKSVLSEENKVIVPEMVLGPKRRGFKIVIAFDGLYVEEEFVPFAIDADVLVMESTYGDEHEKNAKERLHSTARWSARIAKKANAKRLYLTHISPRFKEDDTLQKEAQEEYPNAVIAYDGLEINLTRRDLEEE
jgi:ribonuclease Z